MERGNRERERKFGGSLFGRWVLAGRVTRGTREVVDLPLYTLPRHERGEGKTQEREPLAARALYYIIGGHFGPPKSLSEHKKYEVLLGPPFFRAASGAASPDRTVTEKGGAKERARETKTRDEDRRDERGIEGERGGRPG